MQEIVDFIMRHWMLWTVFFCTLWLILREEKTGVTGDGMNVSVQKAVQLGNKGAVFIDVREPDEFKQGHLVNAELLPLKDLAAKPLSYAKDKVLVFYCLSGQRSRAALMQARKQGYTESYSISGGIKAWREAGMPVVN